MRLGEAQSFTITSAGETIRHGEGIPIVASGAKKTVQKVSEPQSSTEIPRYQPVRSRKSLVSQTNRRFRETTHGQKDETAGTKRSSKFIAASILQPSAFNPSLRDSYYTGSKKTNPGTLNLVPNITSSRGAASSRPKTAAARLTSDVHRSLGRQPRSISKDVIQHSLAVLKQKATAVGRDNLTKWFEATSSKKSWAHPTSSASYSGKVSPSKFWPIY